MNQPSWSPASRENCGELCIQQWKSTVAGTSCAPEKLSVLALQRTFEEEESLRKLTNKLEQCRESFVSAARENLDRTIWEFNQSCTKEIKMLTSRLIAFLEDIKSQLQKSRSFEEIVPRWKDQWDSHVDQWSCDIHAELQKLQNRIVEALRDTESSLIESRKLTAVQLECFLNDRVNKLNQLMIGNERTYSDAERHLKLVFDTLLRKWLLSYSYREIVTTKYDSVEEEEGDDENDPVLPETVAMVDQLIAGLDRLDPEFTDILALKLYLDHLRMCQQHVKLHSKEALLHLKTHLLDKQEYLNQEEVKKRLGELWKEIVTLLKEQNDDFENFSKQSAYAWNQFVRRIHCAERTANITISKARGAKLVKIFGAQENINIILDQLREGNSVPTLEQLYDRIKGELENAELLCIACRDDEDEVIKDLVSACFAAYDIFVLQMTILRDNSMDTGTNVYCVEDDLDDEKKLSDLDLIRMKFCVYSAQTWIEGLKETLSMLEAEIPKFLKTLLENVAYVYKGESEYWLMLQLEKLVRRKKRIRLNVLEVRAAELMAHDAAQKRLLQIIDKEMKKLRGYNHKIKKELSSNDTAIVKYLDETKTDKLEDTFEKKINNLNNEALLVNHEHTRVHLIRKGKYETERIFKWLECSCLSYLKAIKLFHEGGNYSADECDQNLKKIVQLIHKMKKGNERALKRLDHSLMKTKETFKRKLSRIVYPNPSEEALLRAVEREANNRLNNNFSRLKEMIKIETYKACQRLKYLKERKQVAMDSKSFQKWHEAMSGVEAISSYFGFSNMFPMLELSVLLGMAQSTLRPQSDIQKIGSSSVLQIAGVKLKSQRTRSKASPLVEGTRSARGSKLLGSRKSLDPLQEYISKSKKKKTHNVAVQVPGIATDSDPLFTQIRGPDEINYLSNTKTMINEALSRTKLILADAYKMHNVPIEKSENQMEKAISTLLYYNLQCESVWTQLFGDYMNTFLAIWREVLCYLLLARETLAYDTISCAIKLKSDYKSSVSKLNVQGVKDEINALKPSRDSPLDESLLLQLFEDVSNRCKGQLDSRKALNETYAKDLEALITENKDKAADIVENAKFLFLELHANPALNTFLKNVTGYVNSKEFGLTSIEPEWIKKALQEYCTKHRARQMSIHSATDVQTFGPDRDDAIEFKFLDGYDFWCFPQHMKNVHSILSHLKDEFQLPTKVDKSEYVLSSMKLISPWSEEGSEELDEEMTTPFWLLFKKEISQYVQDFETRAIKNLIQVKKDSDAAAKELIGWINEWITNVEEGNGLK